MTNESRSFVEPEDFLGVEFECTHCHTRLYFKLPEKPMRIPAACPNCNELFYGSTMMESFQELFRLLIGMRRLTENTKLKLRFEVASREGA